MARGDKNPQGRIDAFKPTCIVVVVLVLVILVGVIIVMYTTIKHGLGEVEEKASESSSLPDSAPDIPHLTEREGLRCSSRSVWC